MHHLCDLGYNAVSNLLLLIIRNMLQYQSDAVYTYIMTSVYTGFSPVVVQIPFDSIIENLFVAVIDVA